MTAPPPSPAESESGDLPHWLEEPMCKSEMSTSASPLGPRGQGLKREEGEEASNALPLSVSVTSGR